MVAAPTTGCGLKGICNDDIHLCSVSGHYETRI